MAGRGPAPDPFRVRRGKPARGDWAAAPEGGWAHPRPKAPKGLLPATARVWDSWFAAWWAANWTPDDLPQLRFVIRLHDRVSRGDVRRLGELRQWLDTFGITPKGRQDRRWAPPQPRSRLEGHASAGSRPGAGLSARERLRALEGDPYAPLRE